MEETGLVIELKGSLALVRVKEGSGCEGCSGAGSCKAVSGERVLEAENSVGAKPGQRVLISIGSGAFLKASFLVYMVPIIFLFIGAYVGGKVGPTLYPGLAMDYWQALTGATFLALSAGVIRLYDKRVKKGTGLRPVIVSVVEETEACH